MILASFFSLEFLPQLIVAFGIMFFCLYILSVSKLDTVGPVVTGQIWENAFNGERVRVIKTTTIGSEDTTVYYLSGNDTRLRQMPSRLFKGQHNLISRNG